MRRFRYSRSNLDETRWGRISGYPGEMTLVETQIHHQTAEFRVRRRLAVDSPVNGAANSGTAWEAGLRV